MACRQIRPKREMVRIVKTPEGDVTIDKRGKAAGRGAYLCRCRRCWATALQTRRLDHALRAPLSEQEREALRLYGERLPEDQPMPVRED